MLDPENRTNEYERRNAYGSRPTAREKRILLHGTQLHRCRRQAQTALARHRFACEGQQKAGGGDAAGTAPQLHAAQTQPQRGTEPRYAVQRLYALLAEDHPHRRAGDHLVLLQLQCEEPHRPLLRAHRHHAGGAAGAAHPELLPARAGNSESHQRTAVARQPAQGAEIRREAGPDPRQPGGQGGAAQTRKVHGVLLHRRGDGTAVRGCQGQPAGADYPVRRFLRPAPQRGSGPAVGGHRLCRQNTDHPAHCHYGQHRRQEQAGGGRTGPRPSPACAPCRWWPASPSGCGP